GGRSLMKFALYGAMLAGAAMLVPGAAEAQDGDAAAGEAVFAQCAGCHAVGPDAAMMMGPPLNGVIDSAAGAVEGYAYSDAMATSGLTWDVETLTAFLHTPMEVVPGTKMPFPGIADEAAVTN